MSNLINLFKKYRSVGVVGNANTSKSSFCLSELIKLKQKVDIEIYILGAEENLNEYLESKGINILNSIDDVLDMKITNSLIYIDEFADLYDVKMASKQTSRIRRFFNRIYHLNNYILISTAQSKFWNVFMCSLVKAYVVKQIDYDALVRGTFLKRKIKNIAGNTSEYRLEVPNNTYFLVTDEEIVEKGTFEYDENLDSKKDLKNPFLKLDLNLETKLEIKNEENNGLS